MRCYRQNGGVGTTLRNIAGRCPRLGEGHNGGGFELDGDIGNRPTDRIGNRHMTALGLVVRFIKAAINPLHDGVGWSGTGGELRNRGALVFVLDTLRNFGHGRDSFNRKLTDGGFVREHHRVGAIQNRIGDIRDFSTGGAGITHHTVQHLRGGNHRNPEAVRGTNEALLEDRHLLGGYLNTEITTGDHHPIADSQNRIQMLNGFVLLEFDNNRYAPSRLGH